MSDSTQGQLVSPGHASAQLAVATRQSSRPVTGPDTHFEQQRRPLLWDAAPADEPGCERSQCQRSETARHPSCIYQLSGQVRCLQA